MKTSTSYHLLVQACFLPTNSIYEEMGKKGIEALREFLLLQNKARPFSGIHLHFMYKRFSWAVGVIPWKWFLCVCVNDFPQNIPGMISFKGIWLETSENLTEVLSLNMIFYFYTVYFFSFVHVLVFQVFKLNCSDF